MTTQSGGGGRQPISASTGNIAVRSEPSSVVEVSKLPPVLIRRSALQSLPDNSVSYVGYDIWEGVIPGLGKRVIGATLAGGGVVTVPSQQALDISEINFVAIVDLLGLGWGWVALADYSWSTRVTFNVEIGGKSPWDQYTISVFGRLPGWSVLNQNVLASWSDTPVHLVVPPGQTVQFTYDQVGGVIPAPGATGGMGVRFRGRWLPEKLWREVVRDAA